MSKAMKGPENVPGTARTDDFRRTSRKSDLWLVVLVAVSALGLAILTLALTGHL